MAHYEDPILRRIRELLDKYGPKQLRGRWSVGDSMNVPANALPRGFISYDNERISDVASSVLRDNCNVVITVAVDMKKEFDAPTNRSESHEQVVEFLAAKDDNYRIRVDSVVGCLRKYQDLDSGHNLWIEVGTETEVDYGLGLEKRGPGIMTAEGTVRFQVTSDQTMSQSYS